MPFQIAARPDTLEEQPIPPLANFQPNRIIVREIDVTREGSFDFYFKDPDVAFPYSEFNRLINEVLTNGTHTRGTPVPAYHRPLDLNVASPSYVMFYVARDLNLRFCHKYRGVTLGQFVNPIFYGELFHVIAGQPQSPTPIPHSQASCKLVHFKASPPRPDPPGFADSMNINLEIVREDQPNEPPNTTPIVIDPDIRNPDGSTN